MNKRFTTQTSTTVKHKTHQTHKQQKQTLQINAVSSQPGPYIHSKTFHGLFRLAAQAARSIRDLRANCPSWSHTFTFTTTFRSCLAHGLSFLGRGRCHNHSSRIILGWAPCGARHEPLLLPWPTHKARLLAHRQAKGPGSRRAGLLAKAHQWEQQGQYV